MRAAVAIIGLLLLGGCMADTQPEQPTMYLSMANGGATLDPLAAASMISLYRQNNGLGAVAVDPDPGAPRLPDKRQLLDRAGRNDARQGVELLLDDVFGKVLQLGQRPPA